MRILFIASCRETIPERVAPLGAYLVASALESSGHEVTFLDLGFCGHADVQIAKHIRQSRPELVAISVRNIDIVTYPNHIFVLPLVKVAVTSCRKHTSAPILVGGSAFSLIPEAILDYFDADYGIMGAGETSVVQFVEFLEQRRRQSDVPGLVFREKGTICRNPFDLGMPKGLPLRHKQASAYSRINVQTKRGCPFKCVYCVYPFLEGNQVRCRNPEEVADEVELLQRQVGVRSFAFVDSIFNFPTSHAHSICDELIKKNLQINWSCDINPAYFTAELAEKMFAAGCREISIGVDSLADEVLLQLGKSFCVDDVHHSDRLAKTIGFKAEYFLIFGGPGENSRTVLETFNNLRMLKLQHGIALTGIRIYPQTKLWRDFCDPNIGLLRPRYFFPEGKEDEILTSVRRRAGHFAGWIFPGLGLNLRTEDAVRMMEYASYPDWKIVESS